jgi:aspartyl-tRNA(Asn)/glutamyl-tRNA(Gln) amidotransferase subunit B
MAMEWETVIGFETHAQLSTQSKIFSGAAVAFGAEPNALACAVDIALPGTLPVLNRGAVERAIRFGLAVGGSIARRSVFARKNYFYPDLPKGYQISQYEQPIVSGGTIRFQLDGVEKTVQLTRAHLEEDAGKSLHEDFHGLSGIDLNRAGTPLLEIVSEPEMRSSEEAVAYAKALHSLVRWIDICDGNMQEGSFRCDANVSVRRKGDSKLGTRREIKNLNSFRFLQQAIDYEVHYQIETLENGGVIQQATVLFDPVTGETRVMRSKEDAHDYRYFPDPDLLPLSVSEDWIAEIKSALPELPGARTERYLTQYGKYGLTEYDARMLTADEAIGRYFEGVCLHGPVVHIDADHGRPADPKLCANWVIGEVARKRNEQDFPYGQFWVSEATLGRILDRLKDGSISAKVARDLFNEFWDEDKARDFRRGPEAVDEIIEKRGLKQISDSGAIERMIDEIIAANAAQVAEYRSGKDKAFNFLIGQAMKATKGKANPAQVNEILKRKLVGN